MGSRLRLTVLHEDSEPPRSAATDFRGRGAAANPAGRFEPLDIELDEPLTDGGATRFYRDNSRSAISFNDSPDIPFEAAINPYRGCEHGCCYCYARPFHEYLGLSSGLDFERVIFVKPDIAALLRRELSARSWSPKVISLSSVTDAYQPVERKLGLTRQVLEVLRDFRNPVGVITKNRLVMRDMDLLGELGTHGAARLDISLTTLDNDLAAAMEPRASSPRGRLDAIRAAREAGVPVGVGVSPVVPGLTDHEVPAILEAAAEAGAQWAWMLMVRLPGAVEGLFTDWLRRRRPLRAGKVESLIRGMRGGRLNDPRFGHRFRGTGPFADQVKQMFKVHRQRHGLAERGPKPSTAAFRKPGSQGELF